MQRVKTGTAVTSKPAYAAGGTPGYFTSGNAVASIPATTPGQDWYNMVQEEIAHVITAAGLTLSAEDDTQLRQAIAALIAAQVPTIAQATTTAMGVVELATTAEAVAGTDTERAVTPAGLKAALSTFDAGDDALEMSLIFNAGR